MQERTEVLVIGAGVAGVTAALAAARQGAEVLLLDSSEDPMDCNSAHAQGGVIWRAPGDSPELLVRDIEAAGAGLCCRPAVEHLAQNGPPLLKNLLIDELAVDFDRDAAGELDRTEEGAHSLARIVHAEDRTGPAIVRRLLEALEAQPNVTVLRGAMAVDLLSPPNHGAAPLDVYRRHECVGAYVLDAESKEIRTVRAQETILAAGGLGRLYLHSTNPPNARGDGVAMAYRTGARLQNLEYIQFHPTTLYHRDADSFLISESLRGEGAVLVDHRGREFMEGKHPRASLAPRDVVARAIHNEMLESGRPCVYLDATGLDAEWLVARFPYIHKTCLRFGIDITREPIPVVPAAHYACGGVVVDLKGRSTVPRLWAVGEVSCTGVHGANRLASTSLLEGLLWGWEAGAEAARAAHGNTCDASLEIRPFVAENDPVDPALIHQDWRTIHYTMWNYVGLIRTPRRMSRAMSILRELQFEILSFYQKARPTAAVIALRNGITAALAILFAAQRNHVSRGCHYIEKD